MLRIYIITLLIPSHSTSQNHKIGILNGILKFAFRRKSIVDNLIAKFRIYTAEKKGTYFMRIIFKYKMKT